MAVRHTAGEQGPLGGSDRSGQDRTSAHPPPGEYSSQGVRAVVPQRTSCACLSSAAEGAYDMSLK